MIFNIVGPPSEEDLKVVPNEEVRDYIRKLPRPATVTPLAERFPKARPEAVDLLSKMLVFNPHKRLTAVQCLEHPYLSEYHDPEDEPTSDSLFEWDFEQKDLSRDEAPPPPSRTNWTHLVPPPVLTGHVSSLLPY